MGSGRFELPSQAPEARELTKFSHRAPDLNAFREFCLVDLQLGKSTTEYHLNRIRRLPKRLGKDILRVTTEDLRTYLMKIKESMDSSTYKNELASLKRFYGDFLGMEYLVKTFKYPKLGIKPIIVPSKHDLQIFYQNLKTARDRALFLTYATTGLRANELLSLEMRDIDLEKRMVKPRKAENESKHAWLSFYNEEAERDLKEYLKQRDPSKLRLFPISKRQVLRIFKEAEEKCGVHISPQVLREWFCSEMGELGVPDRYVDAFCGRVPKSILARHYSDFSPEKLKRIYDKVNLKIL